MGLWILLWACLFCWKEQNVQQHNAVWTTDNHLSVVSTIIESLGSTHNDRGQVVVLMIQPM